MSDKRGRYFLRLLDNVVTMGKSEAKEEGLTFSSYIEKLIISDIGAKKGKEALKVEDLGLEQRGSENVRKREGTPGDNDKAPKK